MFTITIFWSDIVAVFVAAVAFAVAVVVDRNVSDGETRTVTGVALGILVGIVGIVGVLAPTTAGRHIADAGAGLGLLAVALFGAAVAVRRRDCLEVMVIMANGLLLLLGAMSVLMAI